MSYVTALERIDIKATTLTAKHFNCLIGPLDWQYKS